MASSRAKPAKKVRSAKVSKPEKASTPRPTSSDAKKSSPPSKATTTVRKSSGNLTVPTANDVEAFVAGIVDPVRRRESEQVLALLRRVTGEPGKMWGSSIVGFVDYHYRYESGREGDFFRVGFSPRKQSITLYLSCGFDEMGELAAKLGPHTVGKSCLYLPKIDGIDLRVLESMVRFAAKHRALGEV